MNIGVCYFPEHWSRDRWRSDVEGMAETGIEYVRMAEFSWSRLEPEPGTYDFEWLETAVDLVGEYDMEAVLCTPTATPPKWLVDEHPGIRQADPDGTPRQFGSRRHYCFNAPAYRRESARIVEAVADRFADHPAVAGWQTDNEYGCHDTIRCYCEDCASAFRAWLRERYGDAETLNEAWGTTFWSQEHLGIHEVDVPRPTPANHHPSRLLDYYRFASDSVVEYNRLQAELLRDANDDWFVTHNFMCDFGPLDAREVSADLDFASCDSYPTLRAQLVGETDPAVGGTESEADQRAGDPDVTALNHGLYRTAGDGTFWIMEAQSGDIRGFPYSAEPADGMVRLWSHAAVAHGADTVSYFRWRRCRYGQEQYWGGLYDHDGSADRGLPEAARTAEELASLPDLGGVDAEVALLHDYESLWAIESEPHSPDFDYWSHLRAYFRALRRRGVTVDVVGPTTDLTGYAAVVAPSLYLVDDDRANRLIECVEDGGELLLGARSGYADAAGTFREERAPGPLATLVGARVAQHESLAPAVETRVAYDGFADGGRDAVHDFRVWGEWLAPETGTVVATHRSGPATDEPAAVRTTRDDGAATYVGVWPGEELADALVTDLLAAADVAHGERAPERVRLAERDGLTWVLNHGDATVRVDAPAGAEFHVGDPPVGSHDLAVVEAPAHELRLACERR